MSYRGPQPTRMEDRANDIFQHAGHSVLWRHWVSATPGNPALGIAAQDHYAHRTISALFADFNALETQTVGGLLAAAMVQMTTNEQTTRNDLITWRGVDYQIDSDPVPDRVRANWISVLKRQDA